MHQCATGQPCRVWTGRQPHVGYSKHPAGDKVYRRGLREIVLLYEHPCRLDEICFGHAGPMPRLEEAHRRNAAHQ